MRQLLKALDGMKAIAFYLGLGSLFAHELVAIPAQAVRAFSAGSVFGRPLLWALQ